MPPSRHHSILTSSSRHNNDAHYALVCNNNIIIMPLYVVLGIIYYELSPRCAAVLCYRLFFIRGVDVQHGVMVALLIKIDNKMGAIYIITKKFES